MNYMYKFMSNFKEFYNEINSATLTGAIDVIVIQQENGTYLTSPFHVRFGKIGVLRSREKVVDIEINGEPVNIRMKLGESGEAFFVEETDDPTEFPSYLATSPLPSYPDIEEELKKERASAKPPFDSTPHGYPSDTSEESESKLVVIKSMPHSSSVSDGFKTDEIEDNNNMEQQLKTPQIISRLSSSFAEDSAFRPIESLESQDQCGVVTIHDSNLETVDLSQIEEDKSKTKRKKRRKLMLKRRQQQQYFHQQHETTADSIPSEPNDRVSCERDTAEDIFQMDGVTVQCESDEVDSKTSITELLNADLQDVIADDSKWQYQSLPGQRESLHRYSDGEMSPAYSPQNSRPSTPKSDTEYELKRMEDRSDRDEHRWSWTWGELPVPPKIPCENQREDPASDDDSSEKAKQIKKDQEDQRSMLGGVLQFMRMSKKTRQKAESEGMYLDDLLADDLDPEIANLYLARNASASRKSNRDDSNVKDDDTESGNGSSLPHSPHSVEGGIGGGQNLDSDSEEKNVAQELKEIQEISFSLCGNLNHSKESNEKFDQSLVSFETFCNNPALINNPNLVIRIDGKFFNWQTAAPMVMSLLVFHRPLPGKVVSNLIKDQMPKKQSKSESKGYSWFSWRRSSGTDVPGKKSDDLMLEWNQERSLEKTDVDNKISPRPPLLNIKRDLMTEMDHVNEENFEEGVLDAQLVERLEKYKKSLRLSSEQIAELNLKEGPNEAVFSVTTAYQGTTRCKCHIYLWKYDDQIIISDIDGTITKSDVLGHILPIVGKSWAQSGVAQLFTNIKNNGYQFMYLSARAIGQARITRDYLRSIRQGDVSLPDGPLLLSPSSLISALHREVIEKKPEAFKISCLRDIQALFPDRNPFYAGYGNKINDVWAYRAVGIPMSRIFTINHRGELKHELNSNLKSSYSGLTYVVDHIFPPLQRTKFSNGYLTSNFIEAEEYSSFTFWRDTPQDLSLNEQEDKLSFNKVTKK